MEFAVTDVLCKSRLWDIASLNADSSDNVRVNQSEVALFSALLKHSSNEKDYQLSKVHLFSEKVDISAEVIDGFLSTPLMRPDSEPDDITEDKEPSAVLGVLWKGFRIDVNGTTSETVGLHCLPIDKVSEETEIRSARAPSLNSHYAVMDIPRKRSSSQRKSDEESDNPTLEYQLLYTAHVKADISHSRLCVVPVTLVMKSYSNEDVSVLVGHETNEEGLLWSGKTNSKVTISPHNETSVQMNVTILQYGVYNLSSLTVMPDTNCKVKAHSNLPSLLVVEKG